MSSSALAFALASRLVVTSAAVVFVFVRLSSNAWFSSRFPSLLASVSRSSFLQISKLHLEFFLFLQHLALFLLQLWLLALHGDTEKLSLEARLRDSEIDFEIKLAALGGRSGSGLRVTRMSLKFSL